MSLFHRRVFLAAPFLNRPSHLSGTKGLLHLRHESRVTCKQFPGAFGFSSLFKLEASPFQSSPVFATFSSVRSIVHVSPFPDVVIPDVDVYTYFFGNADDVAPIEIKPDDVIRRDDDGPDDAGRGGDDAAVDRDPGGPDYIGRFDSREKAIIVDGVTGRSVTKWELARDAAALGSALRKRGLGAGDVVGVFAPNSIEYLTALLGVIGCGAALTPINNAFRAEEVGKQMSRTSAKFLFTTRDLRATAEDALRHFGLQAEVILMDGAGTNSTAFSTLLADVGDAFPTLAERRASICPSSSVALIPFSSGTTGLPKGVELSHRNLLANICQCGSRSELLGPTTDGTRSRVLSILPMWHLHQLYMSLLNLRVGSVQFVMSKFEPSSFLNCISNNRLDFLPIVPPLVVYLSNLPDTQGHHLASVKEILCGSAPLGKEIQDEVKRKFDIKLVRQSWGLTETTSHVTISPTNHSKSGSCGVLVPNNRLKIVATDSTEELGTGELGEIVIQGPQRMKGYLNNSAATAAMIDGEGWLKTGDIGYVDEDGYVYVVDRLKELIKYKGHQVAPAELEALLLSHPNIADVAVVGVPHEQGGEVPRAFVRLKDGQPVSAEEVCRFLDDRVNPMARLRGGVRFLEEIPKSASGKIFRKELRKFN